MNIEQKSASVAKPGTMDSRFGKPKAVAAGGSPADGGGFMSMLMALGAADSQDAAGSMGLTTGGDASLAADGQAAGLLATGWGAPGQDAAQMLQQQGVLTSAQSPSQAGMDATQTLQQQGVLTPGQPPSQSGVDVAQLLQQQGLIPAQAQLPGGDVAPQLRREGASELVPAGAVSAVKTPALTGLTQAVPDVPDVGLPVPSKTGGAALGKATRALSAQLSGAEQTMGRQDADNMSNRGKEVVLTRAMEATTSAVLSELMAASAPGGDVIRQTVRQADRHEGAATGRATEGGPGVPAFQVGGQMDLQATSTSVSGASPEATIAEQVHYWISNDVQNAELKLDNWGQSPVEVSISLQGNEARVAFRTDVQELRQVLEGATAHLKDMLQGEGLVLAGVSVGASGTGSGAGGSKEQAPRSDVRRATVTLPQTVAVARPARAGDAAGRAVDIFV